MTCELGTCEAEAEGLGYKAVEHTHIHMCTHRTYIHMHAGIYMHTHTYIHAHPHTPPSF